MKATVPTNQAEAHTNKATPEQIGALELALTHWDDLNQTQRNNAFRLALELLPSDRRQEAIGAFLTIFCEQAVMTTAH